MEWKTYKLLQYALPLILLLASTSALALGFKLSIDLVVAEHIALRLQL